MTHRIFQPQEKEQTGEQLNAMIECIFIKYELVLFSYVVKEQKWLSARSYFVSIVHEKISLNFIAIEYKSVFRTLI